MSLKITFPVVQGLHQADISLQSKYFAHSIGENLTFQQEDPVLNFESKNSCNTFQFHPILPFLHMYSKKMLMLHGHDLY